MSLAYNLNGEAFDVPAAATGWRVRRIRPKGAPEVVFGNSGLPLVLPIEADIDDLRNEVPGEGRYRLDPVDDYSRPIANAPSAYVCIHPPKHTTEPSAEPTMPRPMLPGADQSVIEAMRINAELSKTIVEKFSTIVDSVAGLVRATNPIGALSRLLPESEATATGDDEGDESEPAAAAPKSGIAGLIDSIVTAATPAVVSSLLSGGLQIPGGLGALIDCRRASPTARAAAEARATGAATIVPASAPHDSAPASREPAPTPRPARRAPAAGAVIAARAAQPSASTPAPGGETSNAVAHGAPAVPPADLPTLDPAAITHFGEIQQGLTLEESMHARALAAELSPAELRAWLAELLTLSVPDAVAKLRGVINAGAPKKADP